MTNYMGDNADLTNTFGEDPIDAEDEAFLRWEGNLDAMILREEGHHMDIFGDAPTRAWFDAEESITNAYLKWRDMRAAGELG